MKTLPTLASLLAVAVITFWTPPANATVMQALDLSRLATRADRIVMGKVESQRSEWTRDKSAIYTEVKIRVTRAYKGDAKVGEVVTVRREGGVVDGVGMRVHGAAAFSDGEEAVLFVERRGVASYVVGMTQGKLAVTVDSRGQKIVAQSVSGVAFTDAAQPLRPKALSEFERDLVKVLSVKPEPAR